MTTLIAAIAALISVGILCSVIAICFAEMSRAERSDER
jgi:hypothetical protein